jgi:hypothetical protein
LSRHLPLAALLIAAPVIAVGQAGHVTPFTGTWKLNLSKSSFEPGPAFRSFTLTFTPDGTRHLEVIGADGRALEVSVPWSAGKEVPVTATGGMEGATATSSIRGRKFHDTWRQNGLVIEEVHGVVSADGLVLTIDVDGTDSQGRSFHNRLAFDRG